MPESSVGVASGTLAKASVLSLGGASVTSLLLPRYGGAARRLSVVAMHRPGCLSLLGLHDERKSR
jgi:hypothetical protein